MLNKIILIGRLTRDPEIKYTTSGQKLAKFTLAVDRGYKSQDGQKQTDFIDIAAWRKLADSCESYCFKGQMIAVVGQLNIRQYETPDGSKRRAAEVAADEVRFLEWQEKRETVQQETFEENFDPLLDDELPF